MEIKIQKLPKSTIELIIELNSEEFNSFLKKAESELASKISIPGFRPGKAPINLFKKEISEAKIYEKAAQMAIEETYWQVIKEKNLEPINLPKIEILKLAKDNPFIYKATFFNFPQVKICDFKKIKVKRKKIEIKEEKVERLLNELRISRRKEILVERPAQKGDRLEIDFEMFFNKVPLENGQGKNVSFLLGESYYIPGLEEKLIGMKKGEIKEFSLEYPENFYDKKLAGRKIDFRVKINSIYQVELPNLDDNFAQSVGNFKNLEELKEQLRKNLEEEEKNKEEERLELEMLDQIIKNSDFEEIPEIIINEEKEKIIEELEKSLEMSNLKFEDYLLHIKKTKDELKEEFTPQAEKRVKTALIIGKIAQEYKFFVSDEELGQEINRLLKYYQYDLEAQRNIRTDEYQNYLRNFLLNRKIIQWLKNQVIIED